MALSHKQRAFVEAYLQTFNGTEAYVSVYHPKSRDVAAVNAHRLLRNAKVQEAVSIRLQERAMPADEVLSRLADHARGSMADFIRLSESGDPYFDYQAAQDAGKLHLIKKLKTKTKTRDLFRGNDEVEQIVEVDAELELYDAQAALALLGKHHKLFSDSLDVHLSGQVAFTADEAAAAAKELAEWKQQRNDAKSSGSSAPAA